MLWGKSLWRSKVATATPRTLGLVAPRCGFSARNANKQRFLLEVSLSSTPTLTPNTVAGEVRAAAFQAPLINATRLPLSRMFRSLPVAGSN